MTFSLLFWLFMLKHFQRGQLSEKEFAPMSKFFPFKVDPLQKGDANLKIAELCPLTVYPFSLIVRANRTKLF